MRGNLGDFPQGRCPSEGNLMRGNVEAKITRGVDTRNVEGSDVIDVKDEGDVVNVEAGKIM